MMEKYTGMHAAEQKKPQLSVITICFNRVADISQTCESIVEQTWRGFEWIVVDGGSTDGTLDVLERYRSSCASLTSEPDTGIYNAMNKGLALAKGEYVLFLNGGDRLSSNSSLGESFAAAELGADILYGDMFLERDGVVVERDLSPSATDVDALLFASGATLPHPASFIRRSLFEKHGLYDETYRIIGDLERWVVFAKSGCSFGRLDAAVSVFKLGGVSDDKQPTNALRLAETERMLKTHYTVGEVAEARRRRREREGYAVTRAFLPLGAGVSLFSRKETRRGTRNVKWCVFGLPVLKRRHVPPAKNEYLLMGFIPLFSVESPTAAN